MVFVHHTATPNGYAPDDVPAIIRSIYTYHVRSNGWNDIGYNFLVDAFGRVFEGRAGGIDKPVIGAQTGGFNTGSVGIAVIGDGAAAPLTAATREALTKLIAWRLDVAHVDPLGRATLDLGRQRPLRRRARARRFRVVSGHRDALSTDCPGALIYPELDAIAAAAQALGTPKIVDATATPPALGTDADGVLAPIAFRARVLGGVELDADRARRARRCPSRATAAAAATSRGPGTARARMARSSRPERSSRTASRRATPRARTRAPLLASLGALPAIAQAPPLSLAPAVISPDGDGADDALAIGYTLAAPGRRHARRRSRPDGTTVGDAGRRRAAPGRRPERALGRRGPRPASSPTASTRVRLHIVDATGQVAERTRQVAVIRAVRKLRLSRAAVGRNDARDRLLAADAAVVARGRARRRRARARRRP